MSQQQYPLQQDTVPFWIYVQNANSDVVDQVEQYYDQYQRLQPPYSYGGADDSGVGQQFYTPFPSINLASATNYLPPLQAYHQPLVTPFFTPPSSSPIPIPDSHGPTTKPSPPSSLSTSASTSSSVSTANPEVCRQALPNFNEETQRWFCGGCKKTFSDKYGTDRHIATVGLKVTCRYCSSRVSALEHSRRRHLGRDSCRREAIRRGFTTRDEGDAFLEEH